MNKVILFGNLGADPELKVTQSGSAVLKLRLATTEKFKDKDGKLKESTQWHSCSLWGKRAEALAKFLVKGDRVLVNGAIEYSSYEKDGEKRYRTDIKVLDLELTGRKGGGGGDGNGRVRAPHDDDAYDSSVSDPDPAPVGDDDIPF